MAKARKRVYREIKKSKAPLTAKEASRTLSPETRAALDKIVIGKKKV